MEPAPLFWSLPEPMSASLKPRKQPRAALQEGWGTLQLHAEHRVKRAHWAPWQMAQAPGRDGAGNLPWAHRPHIAPLPLWVHWWFQSPEPRDVLQGARGPGDSHQALLEREESGLYLEEG